MCEDEISMHSLKIPSVKRINWVHRANWQRSQNKHFSFKYSIFCGIQERLCLKASKEKREIWTNKEEKRKKGAVLAWVLEFLDWQHCRPFDWSWRGYTYSVLCLLRLYTADIFTKVEDFIVFSTYFHCTWVINEFLEYDLHQPPVAQT